MATGIEHPRDLPTPDVIDEPHPALDAAIEPTEPRETGLDKVVFGVTAVVSLAFLVWGFLSTDSLADASGSGLGWTMKNTGWLFVLTSSAFVVFVIWLALGKFGNIPLGRDDEEPEFRTISWVAMMFSAGMGIGLMFYGVSEPISHFVTPPPGTGAAGNTEAAQHAMATTMFHWTLHPWAIYAVVGLAVAYGVYRKGRLQLISSAFEPLIGRHAHGLGGKAIDMFAIFATLFGSATSLGLGALQIESGLQIVAGLGDTGNGVLVGIIAVLTAAFVLSAVSGVAKGIQWLSNINMVLAVGLALFVFIVGPTVFILNLVPTSIGSYVADLPMMAARTAAEGDEVSTWLSTWTVFYWAWWLSWTPFVGMFIARISRGRTIRQFVTGVLLVPSLISVVWFCIFGGAAINLQQNGTDIAGAGGLENQLFSTLEAYPLATVSSVVVMVLVGIFFVSGADAASIVMGSLSERGTIHPSRPTVIFWGVATGAVAAVMLLVGGAGRAQRPADHHRHRRAALRADHDRPGGRPGEGPRPGPAGRAAQVRHGGRRGRGHHRCHRARRRLRLLRREGRGRQGRGPGRTSSRTTTSSRWTTLDADVRRRGSRSPRWGERLPRCSVDLTPRLGPMTDTLRIGFVTGATPDKWARHWRDRRRERLELVPVTEADQLDGVRDGSLDMALVRLPVDRDGLHCVRLYDELQVAVASRDHVLAAADEEVTTGDLDDEQLVRPHPSGWTPTADQLDWPPMSEQEAIETVAAGTGVVVVPMSVARLHQRKDVVTRVVTDLEPTTIALVWLVDRDDDVTQAFVGVTKGRTARTSR